MSRKRRSNRLTVEQLAEKRDLKERELNQFVMLFVFGDDEHYRSITLRQAKALVASSDAELLEVDTANGRVVCFRELRPLDLPTHGSPTTLTRANAEAVAKSGGKERLTHREQMHVAKVILFPFVGDTKAPLCRPRVGGRDVGAARKLMQSLDRGDDKMRRRIRTQVLRNDVQPLAA